MKQRAATIERKTKETDISLTINLDGTGENEIATGIPFFDHMLNGFARHGLFDLKVHVTGDLEVDSHHTIEDTGIVLGQAIAAALGEKKRDQALRKLSASYGRDTRHVCSRLIWSPLPELSGRVYSGKTGNSGYRDDP